MDVMGLAETWKENPAERGALASSATQQLVKTSGTAGMVQDEGLAEQRVWWIHRHSLGSRVPPGQALAGRLRSRGGLCASVSPAGNRADVWRLGKSGEVWRGGHHLGSVTAWDWGLLGVPWTLGS